MDTVTATTVSDALFMAHVWEVVRSSGYQSILENGDPDGIDFVAKRITENAAKNQSLHDLCVEATKKMIADHISHHVSFVSSDELQMGFGDNRIPKVTIEWVDEKEADPENFEAA